MAAGRVSMVSGGGGESVPGGGKACLAGGKACLAGGGGAQGHKQKKPKLRGSMQSLMEKAQDVKKRRLAKNTTTAASMP